MNISSVDKHRAAAQALPSRDRSSPEEGGARFDELLARESQTPREAPRRPEPSTRRPNDPPAQERGARESRARDEARATGENREARDEIEHREARDEAPARPETAPEDPRLAWLMQVPVAPPPAPTPRVDLDLTAATTPPAETLVGPDALAQRAMAIAPETLQKVPPSAVETGPTKSEALPVDAQAAAVADTVELHAAPRPAAPVVEHENPALQEDRRTSERFADASPARPPSAATATGAAPGNPTPVEAGVATTNAQNTPQGETRDGDRRSGKDEHTRAETPTASASPMPAVSAERVTSVGPMTEKNDGAMTEAAASAALRERLVRAAVVSPNRVSNELRAQGEVNDPSLGRVVVTAVQRSGAVDLHLQADREPTLRALHDRRDDLIAEVQGADLRVGAMRFDSGGTDLGTDPHNHRGDAGAFAERGHDSPREGAGDDPRRPATRAPEASASPTRPARVRAVL